MHKKFVVILSVLLSNLAAAQELNATVSVNADFVNQTNQQIFKSLERSLNDLINKTQWTNKQYAEHERINCSFVFNISQYESDRFTAALQVQSQRPVYESTYETPVFNFQDKDANFLYLEFQPLVYNPNGFETNLVSLVTYYVYIILGLDADTFSLRGGTEYYEVAQRIVNLSQQSGFLGWSQNDGLRNRFWLIDNILSDTFREYRSVMYDYHRLGLDTMGDKQLRAKETIARALLSFETMNKRRPNSFLAQVFFDAKSDEIQQVFSDGPSINITELQETLNDVAPFFASKWQSIKY